MIKLTRLTCRDTPEHRQRRFRFGTGTGSAIATFDFFGHQFSVAIGRYVGHSGELVWLSAPCDRTGYLIDGGGVNGHWLLSDRARFSTSPEIDMSTEEEEFKAYMAEWEARDNANSLSATIPSTEKQEEKKRRRL